MVYKLLHSTFINFGNPLIYIILLALDKLYTATYIEGERWRDSQLKEGVKVSPTLNFVDHTLSTTRLKAMIDPTVPKSNNS